MSARGTSDLFSTIKEKIIFYNSLFYYVIKCKTPKAWTTLIRSIITLCTDLLMRCLGRYINYCIYKKQTFSLSTWVKNYQECFLLCTSFLFDLCRSCLYKQIKHLYNYIWRANEGQGKVSYRNNYILLNFKIMLKNDEIEQYWVFYRIV